MMVSSLFFFLSETSACTRSFLSIDDATATVDTIFSGTVKSITQDGLLNVTVHEALKGQIKNDVKLKGFPFKETGLTSMCNIEVAAVGKKYYFFVFDKQYGKNYYIAGDQNDALRRVNKDNEKAIQEALVKNSPSSDWRYSVWTGLYVRLMADKSSFNVDEQLNLTILFLNHTYRDLLFKYRTWPKTDHSYCDLSISSSEGTVEPVPVPITQSKIEKYFAKHGHSYDRVLKADSSYRFGVRRVMSAKSGYGYKEKLNFHYYPLQPGVYDIAASCKNFFGATIETKSITVEIN